MPIVLGAYDSVQEVSAICVFHDESEVKILILTLEVSFPQFDDVGMIKLLHEFGLFERKLPFRLADLGEIDGFDDVNIVILNEFRKI